MEVLGLKKPTDGCIPRTLIMGWQSLLLKQLTQKTVLEFGSGLNFISRYIVDHSDIGEVYCIEPNRMDGQYRADGFPKLLSLNIFYEEEPKEIQKKFDLVMSIEVAEHIEREKHESLFDFLVSHAGKWVVFSGARVGQGGLGHIAERPEEEWKEEFVKRGMVFQKELTQQIRLACDKKNINHRKNLMVFKHPGRIPFFKNIISKIFS
jgi:hypothetical protein